MIFENAPKFIGLIYAIVIIITLAFIVRKQRFSTKLGIIILLISTGFGFLFFGPMMPYTFQLLILGDVTALGAPLFMAIIGLVLIILLTFGFGRFFCGYVCPIGAVQELLSRLPVNQKRFTQKKAILLIHGFFFILFIVLGLILSVNMLSFFGIYEFFNLSLFPGFIIVFIILLVISIFFYRPFCRFVCPYGLLLSLASLKSVFKLKRNEKCVDCGLCEKQCPTDKAIRHAFKQECYLCMRCSEICPKEAIYYSKKRG